MFDVERKAVWDDLEKLGEKIKEVALSKVKFDREQRKLNGELADLRILLRQKEAQFKAVSDHCNNLESFGKELTGRLMELEEGQAK